MGARMHMLWPFSGRCVRRSLQAARVAAIGLCAAWILGACATQPAAWQPSPAQWQAEQIAAMNRAQAIMDRAQRQRGLLAQYAVMRHADAAHHGRAFHVIFGQYLSWYQTFLGDYIGAERSFSYAELPSSHDAPSPLASARWHAVPALDAIAALARTRRAVFFNENHSAPITRTLTVALLARLRAEGYDTFAAETLYHSDSAALMRRGYATAASGFYTEEPIEAEMVRTALQLGYRVIAYEAATSAHRHAREREEAANLYRRAFAGHPDARLVVDAGFAHIRKRGVYLGGHSMAEDFMRISGIDPLAVEQTMLFGHLRAADNQPIWNAVMRALHPTQPIVFETRHGKPWSLRPGAYDVSVFFPPQLLQRGRPTWLGLWGLRDPYQVEDSLCMQHFPCLIEARPVGEGHDAIPSDRLVLRCAGEIRQLWLRPGRYRLSARDRSDRLLGQARIEVRPQPAPRGGTPPRAQRSSHCTLPGWRILKGR